MDPQAMLQEVRSTVIRTRHLAQLKAQLKTSIPAVCWRFQIRYSIHSLYIGPNSGSNKPY